MVDAANASEGAEDTGRTDRRSEGNRRSRLLLVLLLLLLLLMCAVATVMDVFVTRNPDQVRFIARNVACLQCHTELIPALSKPIVHNPFRNLDCTACHTPHGTEVLVSTTTGKKSTWQSFRTVLEWLPLRIASWMYAGPSGLLSTTGGKTTVATKQVKGQTSYLVAPETELCWICHGNLGPLRSKPYQHAPFQNGYCTNCHDPHASDWPGMLKQDPRALCLTCHPIGGELARAQPHPPAASYFCTNCHDPHASDWKGILVARQRELCFSCHPTVAVLSNKSVQHAPFLNDDCTGCHEPHGSDFRPLLINPQPDLCYRCHPDITLDFLKPSHHPVGTVKLNCSDCHNPHAADFQFLLDARDNAFCYRCHFGKIGVTFETSAHRGMLCIRCHTPHGSFDKPLLRIPDPTLCLACHGSVDHKNAHPFAPRFYDRHANAPLRCTSTCHNPHGANQPFMLNYLYRRDGLCLLCHPGVGVYF